MTIVLFDIDGTLITTGGVGRQAIERAFEEMFNRPDACAHFSFDGMTDRAIMRQGLVALEMEPQESTIDKLIAVYLRHLKSTVSEAPAEDYRIHAGMMEAVAACESLKCAVGLGTGNVRDGARIKLDRVGIFGRFSFGGFGDDNEARDRLLDAGANRGALRLGLPRSQTKVVIIGDSHRDVSAALAIGAHCVGVGTGRHTPEELMKLGATLAFETLAHPGALEALLKLCA